MPDNQIRLAIDEEAFAGDVTRTYTNERVAYWVFRGARLTLEKTVINDGGGSALDSAFTLSFLHTAGMDRSGIETEGNVTNVLVPSGSFDLSETGPDGYKFISWNCNGSILATNTVTLTLGANTSCTVLNDDQFVDLEITKMVDNSNPNVGEIVKFTLIVKNNGPDPATGISVIDVIPAGFSFEGGSMEGGDLRDDSSPAGTGLEWTIDTLLASPAIPSTANLAFEATINKP